MRDIMNVGPVGITDVLKRFKQKEQLHAEKRNNLWQEHALGAIKLFADGNKFRSRIFKCFKDNYPEADRSLVDCKELGKNSALYFLKVYNIRVSKNKQ